MCLVTVRFHSYDKLLIWQVLLSKSSSLRILFLSHSFYSSGVKTCTTLGITRSHLCFMKFGNKTCLYCPAASNGLGYQQVSFSENMTCRRTVGQPCRTQITDRTTLEADNGGNEEKKKAKSLAISIFGDIFLHGWFMNRGVNGPLIIKSPQILTWAGGNVYKLWYAPVYLGTYWPTKCVWRVIFHKKNSRK